MTAREAYADLPARDGTSALRVCYAQAGDGPRLLFISGTGGDLRTTPGVFDSPLPQQFEVLAYDQRGLGRTGSPTGSGPYTMQHYADDAAGLLDALGWERCAVFGVSFGGMVAQELALRHGARVERLVLACTSSGGDGGASYPLHELHGRDAESRARQMIPISDTRLASLPERDPERYARILRGTVERSLTGAGEPGRDEGQRLQLEARRTHDTYARLPSLRMPVLVCGGRFDGIAPPANSEAIARQIPGAQLEMFDGGHLFLMQDRSAYPRIAAFLLAPDE